MKILVTGAAGFIGMHVCEALLAGGHEVVGLDNFNDYYDVQLKRDRMARLKNLPLSNPAASFTPVEIDVTDLPLLERLFEQGGFDRVCHLAAQAGVRYSIENPHIYQKTNLEGFLNLLECCRHNKTGRLVYASSSSVYGGNTELPFSESDRVDTPISLYAATKKANELMAHVYSHLYQVPTVGLRFFTVYGPWGRPDMAMWLFTERLLRGEPINVFNHGNMQRDFTYVDDIVQGVLASLMSDTLDTYEVFNLGNHRTEKLMDLIDTLAQAVGVEPQMNMMPMQPGDVPATYANIDRAIEKLNFKPTTPISVGVPAFVEWFKEYHA